MADSVSSVNSASSTPYTAQTYDAAPNKKNTLSIESYFKLLAAQLANQDMSNPMDTSDMMNQMSQMAMVQSLTSVTSALKSQTTLSNQTYGAGMVGKTVTVNTLIAGDENSTAGTKTGVVASVYFSGDKSTVKLEGDATEYPIGNIVSLENASGTTMKTAAGTEDTEAADSTDTVTAEDANKVINTHYVENEESTAKSGAAASDTEVTDIDTHYSEDSTDETTEA